MLQKAVQVVSLRNRQTELLKHGLQILLRHLLAMEADLVIEIGAALFDFLHEQPIGFGFLNPLSDRVWHTAPFLSR